MRKIRQSRSACMMRIILPGTRLRRFTDTVMGRAYYLASRFDEAFIGRFITMLQRKSA